MSHVRAKSQSRFTVATETPALGGASEINDGTGFGSITLTLSVAVAELPVPSTDTGVLPDPNAQRTADSAFPEKARLRQRFRSPPFAMGGLVLLLAALILAPPAWNRLRGSGQSVQSLAVLPLRNLSGDPEQDYFAEGMTEALITDLARIPGLKVISRTSIVLYKDSHKRLPQIARELGVDGVIEGSVLRSGNRIRITAQLVHGATDRHIWAGSYERDLRDLVTLEDGVSRSIAEQIRKQIAPRPPLRVASFAAIKSAGSRGLLAYRQARLDRRPGFVPAGGS